MEEIFLAVYGHLISRKPNGYCVLAGSYTAPSGDAPRNGCSQLIRNPDGETVKWGWPCNF